MYPCVSKIDTSLELFFFIYNQKKPFLISYNKINRTHASNHTRARAINNRSIYRYRCYNRTTLLMAITIDTICLVGRVTRFLNDDPPFRATISLR